MTPDFLAGLFIGSMLVYACWLLSLRLAEPEDWQMGCGCKIAGASGPYPHPNTWQGIKDAHPDYAMGDPPTGGFYGGRQGDGYNARKHSWDVTCDGPPDDDPDCHCLGVTRSQIRWEKPDRIGDALVLLDKAFSDE